MGSKKAEKYFLHELIEDPLSDENFELLSRDDIYKERQNFQGFTRENRVKAKKLEIPDREGHNSR